MAPFADNLKTLRLQRGYTQEDMAERLGLTKSMISMCERGSRMPSYDGLIAIANMFHVTTDYLLGIQHPEKLDLSGLTEEETTAVKSLIEAMQRRKIGNGVTVQ